METFSTLLALCAGNSRVTREFPSQRPVTRSFDFSLIYTWINGWGNNREVGDLRRHCAHYDVIVMCIYHPQVWRHVGGSTYKIIQQSSFYITTHGLNEFMLNPGERSRIQDGDMIGLFSCFAHEAAVIGYDSVRCETGILLYQSTVEVVSPLTFKTYIAPGNICRHYSFNAIYAGNTCMIQIDIL